MGCGDRCSTSYFERDALNVIRTLNGFDDYIDDRIDILYFLVSNLFKKYRCGLLDILVAPVM